MGSKNLHTANINSLQQLQPNGVQGKPQGLFTLEDKFDGAQFLDDELFANCQIFSVKKQIEERELHRTRSHVDESINSHRLLEIKSSASGLRQESLGGHIEVKFDSGHKLLNLNSTRAIHGFDQLTSQSDKQQRAIATEGMDCNTS